MRKVIIVLCLVAALAGLAVPAFADSVGGDGSVIKESAVQFDYITYNDGSNKADVYEWPFNFTRAWSNASNGGQIDDGFYWTEAQYANGYNSGVFVPGDATSFTLHADTFLFKSGLSVVLGENIDNNELFIYSVLIKGVENVVSRSNNDYFISLREFERYFVPDTKRIDIMDYVASSLQTDHDLPVMITDFEVTVQFYWDAITPDSNHSWFYKASVNDMPRNDVRDWFNAEHIRWQYSPPPDDFNIVSWLENVLGGFLDFEVFPGFSINKIFWLVLVIGILLWFITLLI